MSGLVGWWVSGLDVGFVTPTHQPTNPPTHEYETAPRTAPYKESP
jgi:hypothetical protein